MRIAWCITGAEMFLYEVVNIIKNLGSDKVDIFLSRSAKEILSRYKLLEQLMDFKVYEDTETNVFQVIKLFTGRYDFIVIAPCTTNTIAKMVHGISDNLVTNIFSQGGKLRMPIYILPSDIKEIMEFTTKSGKNHILYMRAIDMENLKKLQNFEGVRILHSIQELKNILRENLP
ncbi:MAG: flavoprotein [Candidatus Hydrothermia bacterium]|jgi:flavoprotein